MTQKRRSKKLGLVSVADLEAGLAEMAAMQPKAATEISVKEAITRSAGVAQAMLDRGFSLDEVLEKLRDVCKTDAADSTLTLYLRNAFKVMADEAANTPQKSPRGRKPTSNRRAKTDGAAQVETPAKTEPDAPMQPKVSVAEAFTTGSTDDAVKEEAKRDAVSDGSLANDKATALGYDKATALGYIDWPNADTSTDGKESDTSFTLSPRRAETEAQASVSNARDEVLGELPAEDQHVDTGAQGALSESSSQAEIGVDDNASGSNDIDHARDADIDAPMPANTFVDTARTSPAVNTPKLGRY